MFTKRRPVPSARTVKFLYQLGYICSGTACGLATLCLEEQRRRIQILQRITDTAKVIRQHPRYRGNVALAVESADSTDFGAVEAGWMPDRLHRRRRRKHETFEQRSEGKPDASGTSRSTSEEQPASGETDLKKPFRYIAAPAAKQITHEHSRGEEYTGPFSFGPTHNNTRSAVERTPTATLSSDDVHGMLTSPLYENSDNMANSNVNSSPQIDTTSPDRSLPLYTMPSSRQAVAPNTPPKRHGTPHRTPDRNVYEPTALEMTPQQLSHDIDAFLVAMNSNQSKSTSGSDIITSNKLFASALAHGSLEHIRALSEWKLWNGSFTIADARLLGLSCRNLGDRLGHLDLFNYLTGLLRTKQISRLDSRTRLRLLFRVLCSSFQWELNSEAALVRDALRDECLHGMEEDVIGSMLKWTCNHYLAIGEVDAAAKLFLHVTETRVHQPLYHLLAADLFSASLERRHLSSCAALLRWDADSVNLRTVSDAWVTQARSFIRACDEQQAYELLLDLFGANGPLKHMLRGKKFLDGETKALISVALSTDPTMHPTFVRLYRTSPRPFRMIINEKSSILALKTTWKATRNLDEVDARITELSKRLKGKGDENALQKLDEATVEIYVQAGRVDRALEIVTRLSKTYGASNVAMCQTALLFARRGSWERFDQLIGIMKRTESFRVEGDGQRVFNALIHIYRQHHTAEEIWEFVAGSIRDLGFVPNRSTLEIMLTAFTSKRRFDLIPKWISYLDSIGHRDQIDSYMAVLLLRQYYVDCRPFHVLMMLLCRKLTLLSPSFASKHLVELVEQAIGYDLRHISGQNGRLQRRHTEKRLERLQGSNGFIPTPGFVWNQWIYFHESESNQSTAGNPRPVRFVPQEIVCDEIDVDEADEASEGSRDVEATFEALRPAYDKHDVSPDNYFENKFGFDTRAQRRLADEMRLYLSTGEEQKALDLYHANLDAAGVPASGAVLEIAVEASLRLRAGDRSDADDIISKAKEAGMNTRRADGPLIIHQLKRLDPENKIDVANLRSAVFEYYRANDSSGWRVKHHLGLCAAHTMIKHGCIREGLDLLSDIYMSKWTKDRPLDIVAMSIFLKGYITLQSMSGIRWVVQTVLEHDIRISKKFITQLKSLYKGDFKWVTELPRTVRPLLVSWVQRCDDRRKKQTSEINALGWQLVQYIVKATEEGSRIIAGTPLVLEDGVPAEDSIDARNEENPNFVDESYYSDESLVEPEEPDRVAKMRRRMAEDWKAERRFYRRLKAAALAQGTSDKRRPLAFEETTSDEYPVKSSMEDGLSEPKSEISDGHSHFKPFP